MILDIIYPYRLGRIGIVRMWPTVQDDPLILQYHMIQAFGHWLIDLA